MNTNSFGLDCIHSKVIVRIEISVFKIMQLYNIKLIQAVMAIEEQFVATKKTQNHNSNKPIIKQLFHN